jgi:hypothetical protein
MSNEAKAERDPQQQDKTASTGSVSTADTKTNPVQENQGNRAQDIAKKEPMQHTDPQHKGQEKSEDEKRRAS